MNNIAKISDYLYDEKLIRARELSKIFIGLSPATYGDWVRKGFLNRYKIGGSNFYKLSEVKRLIENSKEVV